MTIAYDSDIRLANAMPELSVIATTSVSHSIKDCSTKSPCFPFAVPLYIVSFSCAPTIDSESPLSDTFASAFYSIRPTPSCSFPLPRHNHRQYPYKFARARVLVRNHGLIWNIRSISTARCSLLFHRTFDFLYLRHLAHLSSQCPNS